mmetsp:Transcript_1124/g.2425  ORF Transcript_1124/g.2425 Transcript_1124/m.2425 type:complete len:321 (-) Transcript_1124:265-1227(-)
MAGKRKQDKSESSHIDPILAIIKAQLEGIGYSSDIVAEALVEMKAEFDGNDSPDTDSMFDSALSICNRLSPKSSSSEDTADEDVLENKDIDAARVLALETAEEERIKRRNSRRATWISGNILESEDDLRISKLLDHLRQSDMFVSWCKALSEDESRPAADSQRKSARLSTASSVAGAQDHSKIFAVPDADLRRFRTVLADILELEVDVRKWYSKDSPYLFEELGEKISAQLSIVSRSGGANGGKAAPGGGQHSAELAIKVIKEVTETMVNDYETIKKGLYDMPECAGQIPAILVDARRRRSGSRADAPPVVPGEPIRIMD